MLSCMAIPYYKPSKHTNGETLSPRQECRGFRVEDWMNKHTIFLKDYQPPAYLVPKTELTLRLDPEQTLVEARLQLRRNPAAPDPGTLPPLVLHAEKLELESVALDGKTLEPGEYTLAEGLLTLPAPAQADCVVESRVRINPKANLELEGLYLSAGNYCSQCEAEGFRKITPFPDRPDVMSVYTVTLIGDKTECPVLLSNGNLEEEGDLEGGLHFARWHDPFPKPSCIFAVVAGNLVALKDSFTTMSGKTDALAIYVEPRNEGKCGHAMTALKEAMRWDEERFGREYDLDNFKILAVDDFNMGAMENKGLNVFNSKYVLALPETATDQDFENIEGVIGHEYFHNWTGNRIACRDWFQLSLKEGLTVFRDQEFSSDLGSRAVKRIKDVNIIRSIQFKEDAGPMAHPIRPASFVEINNFYTVTVYNKGAEVIRMMHTLLGEAGFRKGMDLYFERHDGQSVTCDDFVAALADANSFDLTRFKRWYSQAGTPEVFVDSHFDPDKKQLALKVRQSCPATPDMKEKEKKPFVMPLGLGLLAADGRVLDFSHQGANNPPFLLLEQEEQDFVLEGVTEKPVLSLLRGFSAPVKLHLQQSDEELSLRLAHDPDPWGRWDAGQQLALKAVLSGIADFRAGKREMHLPDALRDGMAALLNDETADPAFRALALQLPTENWIGQQLAPLDPEAVFWVRQSLRAALGEALRPALLRHYENLSSKAAYCYNTAEAGRRSLRNLCLAYLLCPAPDSPANAEALQLGKRQYQDSDNMTDSLAALTAVVHADREAGDALVADFLARWQHDPLVMDKWLALQASCPLPGTLARVRALLEHPVFDLKNPNKARALIASFCSLNQRQFHAADGAGYQFLGEMVAQLDTFNPQISSRMAAPFIQWRRFDPDRQRLMQAQLEQLLRQPKLSDDLKELVEKSLHN